MHSKHVCLALTASMEYSEYSDTETSSQEVGNDSGMAMKALKGKGRELRREASKDEGRLRHSG